ncbi:hypothetical protein [Paenibacillus sp. FSL R5-0470]|uniref:hypothetical protein n=1 Tax=Paenibacillus sp. FSL R5-0470 TaxID=2921641 RepID=UPI0030DCD9F3
MEYTDLKELQDVFFFGLIEPEVNQLRLSFCKSKASDIAEPLMDGEKSSPIIQVDFHSYIAYSIRNEFFTSWDDYEEFDGKTFRIYKKSRYLDFISNGIFASKDFPKPYKHYGICCIDHVVDIISTSEPVVREII